MENAGLTPPPPHVPPTTVTSLQSTVRSTDRTINLKAPINGKNRVLVVLGGVLLLCVLLALGFFFGQFLGARVIPYSLQQALQGEIIRLPVSSQHQLAVSLCTKKEPPYCQDLATQLEAGTPHATILFQIPRDFPPGTAGLSVYPVVPAGQAAGKPHTRQNIKIIAADEGNEPYAPYQPYQPPQAN